jgi:hypothetical protein
MTINNDDGKDDDDDNGIDNHVNLRTATTSTISLSNRILDKRGFALL